MNLKERFTSRSAKAGVIGLGYVGLPLAVEFAKAGFSVIGIDLNDDKIRMLREGISYIGDVTDTDLRAVIDSGKLEVSGDFDRIDHRIT